MNKDNKYVQLYKDLEEAIHKYRQENFAKTGKPTPPTIILIHPETMINIVIAMRADLPPVLGCSIVRIRETGKYSIQNRRIIQTFDIEPNTFELI